MKRALLRALLPVCFAFLLAAVLLAFAGDARAQELRRAGTVRLEVAPGARGLGLLPAPTRGPLELRFTQEGFVGEIVVVNDGKEPLVVSRIAVRGDAADPRAPPKLSLRLADAVLPVTIAPGTSRRAHVQWAPEHGVRLQQLFAHVVVTTSDEQSGEVAMGVRAQIPGWLGPMEGHVLSFLIGVVLSYLSALQLKNFDVQDTNRLFKVIHRPVYCGLAR